MDRKPQGRLALARSAAALAIAAAPGWASAGAPQARLDWAKLEELRSLVAEAALLERQAAQGRVGPRYAEGVRRDLDQQLHKLAKEPGLGALAAPALPALARRDAAALEGVRDRLAAMERSHGRAG